MLSRNNFKKQCLQRRLIGLIPIFLLFFINLNATTFTVLNTNDNGVGSLRQAVIDANANNNPGTTDVIQFQIPFVSSNFHTITLTSFLLQITEAVIIDGTTQFNFSGSPLIRIDDSGFGSATSNPALQIITSDCQVKGIIFGNLNTGGISADNADNLLIENCFFGTDENGTTAVGTALRGIDIDDSKDIIIRNCLVASSNIGIDILDCENFTIQGCKIGTDINGTAAIPNSRGIEISGEESTGLIGGLNANEENLISGNNGAGIGIENDANNINILGNLIGTDINGTAALPNTSSGIFTHKAENIFIGDETNANGRNIVSGNGGSGIFIFNDCESIFIVGNFIGTDINGTQDLGNTGNGVLILADENTIIQVGTTFPLGRNVISGNGISGVDCFNSENVFIVNNFIGVDVNGTTALGNDEFGVKLKACSDIIIGGSQADEGNVISGNGDDNIIVFDNSSDIEILQNIVGLNSLGTATLANGDEGVHLENSTRIEIGNEIGGRNIISGNDIGILLTNVTQSAIIDNFIGTDIHGSVDFGNATNGILLQNGSTINTIGGVQGLHGNVISGNDGTGIGLQDDCINNDILGNLIGLDSTGTASLGNDDFGVTLVGNCNFNTIGDSLTDMGNVISGNGKSGIVLQENCNQNNIFNNLIGTDINGTTAIGNGNSGIFITENCDSNNIGSHTADFINVISGNAINGILIDDNSNENIVINNFIGVDGGFLGGTTALGNGGSGIRITDNSHNNEIGQATEFGGNIISGNGDAGIDIFCDSNMVVGNFIGVDNFGATALPNASQGIFISDAKNCQVGEASIFGRNIIAGNDDSGIIINGDSNSVINSFIGVGVSGDLIVKNDVLGIFISGGDFNQIGDDGVFGKNVISGNGSSGIQLSKNANHNIIVNCLIGTDSAGTLDLGNGGSGILIDSSHRNSIGHIDFSSINIISGNSVDGVLIQRNSSNNFVGFNQIGTDINGNVDLGNTRFGVGLLGDDVRNTTIDGNIISGNDNDGINMNGNAHLVVGNIVGSDVSGTQDLGNTDVGIVIFGDSSIIGGNAFDRNLISGNDNRGVEMSSANHNIIQGNFIGVDVHGSTALLNNSDGIFAGTNSSENQFLDNVISGNRFDGIEFQSGSFDNQVFRNIIGLDSSGTVAIPNGDNGVEIGDADDNIIGGTIATDRNIISGNGGHGVALFDNSTSGDGNIIQGNYIGLSLDGLSALGNDEFGISVDDGTNTLIRMGNVIADNGFGGIEVNDDGTVIQGTFIGVNALGTAAISNDGSGIEAGNVDDLIIGGSLFAQRNVIVNSTASGIDISGTNSFIIENNFIGTNAGSTQSYGNEEDNILISGTCDEGLIQNNIIGKSNDGNGINISGVFFSDTLTIIGNFIGTDTTGTIDLGNEFVGISCAGSQNVIIGGDSSIDANVIAFNNSVGINVTSEADFFGATTSSNISIFQNNIFDNVFEGISYFDFNAAQTVPPTPQITAVDNLSNLEVDGTLSGSSNTEYRIEFFANDAPNADGNFEGQIFIDKIFATTDGSGNLTFSTNFTNTSVNFGQIITATATATTANSNTSPFSDGQNAVALPVELLTFTATPNDNTIDLNWSTASEENNKGFDIERSTNGNNWQKIGFVQGNGTTVNTSEYNFEDTKVEPNILYYYRLKQLDFDAKFEYSNIVEATIQTIEQPNNQTLNIYPNPASDYLIIKNLNVNETYQIFTTDGKLVQQGNVNNQRINLYNLKSGNYLLKMTIDNKQVNERITIIR